MKIQETCLQAILSHHCIKQMFLFQADVLVSFVLGTTGSKMTEYTC